MAPTLRYRDAKAIHGSSDGWIRWASRLPRNNYMRRTLHNRQEGLCAFCGKPLDYGKSCIHHVDYDRECPVESIRVPAPTKQRPYRKVLTTSCADCVAEDCDRFFECASKLALVHPECNKAISKNDNTPMLHLMDGVVLSVK